MLPVVLSIFLHQFALYDKRKKQKKMICDTDIFTLLMYTKP